MEKTVRLSQCMIVKNEEKNIAQALSWGKDIMWEQIVVDTGSTDRTVEIAESMGAKVYHFPWIDDFAAAKNFALEKATGDWIAFLDADEYLTKEWAGKLCFFLEQLDAEGYDALQSPLFNLDTDGTIASSGCICRFFRYTAKIRYCNPIHEVLTVDSSRIHYQDSAFPVYHTGYTKEMMDKKDKLGRNKRILKQELEKRPDDMALMGYLGDVCSNEDEAEAESWYRKAIALMPTQEIHRDERSATTYIHLLTILANRKDEKIFLELYEKASVVIPWSCDVDYIAGRFYLGKKQFEKARFHFEKAMLTAEKWGKQTFSIYLYASIQDYWEQLALCCYHVGDLSACVSYCVNLLKGDNRRITALTLLLQSLVSEKPEAVLRFMGNLYDLSNSGERLFLVKGVILAEATGVLECLKTYCNAEELLLIEEAIN